MRKSLLFWQKHRRGTSFAAVKNRANQEKKLLLSRASYSFANNNALPMKKRTLRFDSLEKLCAFAKVLPDCGYFLNTVTLTLTSELSVSQIDKALAEFDAQILPTTKKVFSYEL